MEGTMATLPSIASQASPRPVPRPRNHAGATEASVQVGVSRQAPAPVSNTPSPVDLEVAGLMAAELDSALQQAEGDFSVSVDRATGMIVVRITDQATGEIVKQIPPQELLDADVNMEKIVGLLVDDRA